MTLQHPSRSLSQDQEIAMKQDNWKVTANENPPRVVTEEGEPVATLAEGTSAESFDDAKLAARARLIAAAPKMAALLRTVLKDCENELAYGGQICTDHGAIADLLREIVEG